MSELKAVHAFDVYEAYTKTGDDDAAQVYLKSEADKVIAELKRENKRLEKEASCTFVDDCLRLRQTKRKLRHNKYKRCLAMAEICCQKKENCYNRALRKYSKDEADYLASKSEFWQDWESLWLELAERFKERKNAED